MKFKRLYQVLKEVANHVGRDTPCQLFTWSGGKLLLVRGEHTVLIKRDTDGYWEWNGVIASTCISSQL